MAEQKNPNTPPGFPARRSDSGNGNGLRASSADPRAPAAGDTGKDFDSYRRWLSRVQLPDKRRIAMDPSLYTWKGYRNWAEKVRRDWTPDE